MNHITNQFTDMNTIHEFKTDFIENLEQTIFEITANTPLTRVYVSIGSKLNSESVYDEGHPHWKSNALNQMFPTFLCTSMDKVIHDNNTLIIVTTDNGGLPPYDPSSAPSDDNDDHSTYVSV